MLARDDELEITVTNPRPGDPVATTNGGGRGLAGLAELAATNRSHAVIVAYESGVVTPRNAAHP